MAIDHTTLELLRRTHPAWRLLCSPHAPLVVAFLYRVFIVPNVRFLSQSDLVESLEDELFMLRERSREDVYPGSALGYLNDWADNDKGWLRKFYRDGSDEPHFDLMPSTEKAIGWLEGLSERAFVGTESRLLTLFDLLRQMREGSQADPELRIAELMKRRGEIDDEIGRIRQGEVSLLDATALRERFQQFLQMARELLGDFREVEHNFRMLDRRVRERIALWDGSKGKLLEEIMGERDVIADSDQGKSFHAFWDFLMSQSRQEELGQLLEEVLALPPVLEMRPDPRLRRVHYDWLEAGEHTQRTVARLSQQLRRFLDDKAVLESRRIMEILRHLETDAVAVRDGAPSGGFMPLDSALPAIALPMERIMHRPPQKPVLADVALREGEADVDLSALYDQVVVDRAVLLRTLRKELQHTGQVSLAEVLSRNPLRQGLAELVAYLQLATQKFRTVVDEGQRDLVQWEDGAGRIRQASFARIIVMRN